MEQSVVESPNEAGRRSKAAEIASLRWILATQYHVEGDGKPIGFSEEDVARYQCADVSIREGGHFKVVDALASILAGLRVVFLMPTLVERDHFVRRYVFPLVQSVPKYRSLFEFGKHTISILRCPESGGAVFFVPATHRSHHLGIVVDKLIVGVWLPPDTRRDYDAVQTLRDRMRSSPYAFEVL